jgi:uncharacterized protein YdhG (YjbR/CyaY superfamily)
VFDLRKRSPRVQPWTGFQSKRSMRYVAVSTYSGKFNYRYSTLGFQDAAYLDNGDMWPVSYALQKWSAG